MRGYRTSNASIEAAIGLATEYHKNQVDKCGEPYIFHPLRVMMCAVTTEQRIVAVLHDILEDTKMSIEVLSYYFTKEILLAIEAMTKQKSEKYDDYLKRVKDNQIAKVVKILDIKDNASPSRLYKLDQKTILRLTKKYSYALKFLGE